MSSRLRALEPKERLFLAACAGVAALLRIVHLATVHDSPLAQNLFLDPLFYDSWAREIADGAWLGDRPFFQDPGYPYVLGILYRIAGYRHLPVTVLQSALAVLVGPMLYLAARDWFGRRAAATAAGLAALYLPSIYYDGMILKTSPSVFLVSLSLVGLSWSLRSNRAGGWIATGCAIGLATLFRGNLLLAAPVLALWLALDSTALTGRRRRLVAAGLLLAGAAIPVGATAIRNRAVGGEWILTTSNAGQNFFIGNNPHNTTGRYRELPFVDPNPKHEERGFADEARRRIGRELSPAELSRYWMGEARRWIVSDPGGWLRLTWRKTRNYWGAYELPDNLDLYLYREYAPVLRLPLPGFGLVAPLGLLGALLVLRRPGWPRALLVLSAVYAASVIAFFVLSRFRMAMMPAMFVLAGHAVVELVRAARGGSTARRLTMVGLLLVLAAWVHLPVRGPRSTVRVRVAEALSLPLQLETSATGRRNLGLAYARRAGEGDDPELLRMAEEQLRASLDEDPAAAKSWAELGKVLARTDRDEQAIEAYRHAIALEPLRWRNHAAVGVLHRRRGEDSGAERAWRSALEIEPGSALTRTLLGELLLEQFRFDEAADQFTRALALDPGSVRARRGLAQTREGLGGSRGVE